VTRFLVAQTGVLVLEQSVLKGSGSWAIMFQPSCSSKVIPSPSYMRRMQHEEWHALKEADASCAYPISPEVFRCLGSGHEPPCSAQRLHRQILTAPRPRPIA
jgi:hypothetical protein